jgi:hypothetical protein
MSARPRAVSSPARRSVQSHWARLRPRPAGCSPASPPATGTPTTSASPPAPASASATPHTSCSAPAPQPRTPPPAAGSSSLSPPTGITPSAASGPARASPPQRACCRSVGQSGLAATPGTCSGPDQQRRAQGPRRRHPRGGDRRIQPHHHANQPGSAAAQLLKSPGDDVSHRICRRTIVCVTRPGVVGEASGSGAPGVTRLV